MPSLVRLSIISRKLGAYPAALNYALAAHDKAPAAREPLNALGSVLASLKHTKKARLLLTGDASVGALNAELRQFIEGVIADGTQHSPREGSQKTFKDEERAPVDAQELPGAAPKPTLSNLTDDEFQLPNVLGLSRQDRS